MLASIIADIFLFIGAYFGERAVNKTISLKKWFFIAYVLCLTVVLALVFCYTDALFAGEYISVILFSPFVFALFTCLLVKWKIERKAKNNTILII